jgi:hypothetical protein
MLRARLIVFGVALLFAVVSYSAQSQQPPQTPSVQTNQQVNSPGKGEPKTNEQINRAEIPPSVVSTAPPTGLNESSKCCLTKTEEASEYWTFPILGHRLKITDSLLALFTLLLVVTGAWQGWHLRRTVQSYISSDRPYSYPGVFNTSRLLPTGAHAVYPLCPGVPFPEIDWTFMNVGKSPGIIKEIRAELFLGESLPRRPTFTYSEPLSAEFVARADKETDPITFPFNRHLTLTEIDEIGVGTTQFCFFGYVKYSDSFQFLHTKGFAFKIHFHPKDRAVPVGGRQYNYSKSTKMSRNYST